MSKRKVSIKRLSGIPNEMLTPLPLDVETYPQPRNKNLPRLFWLYAIAGQRGSGKTQLGIRMLKNYEMSGLYDDHGHKIPQRTILFSPTYASNPVWKRLDSLHVEDVHETFTDKALTDVVKEITADRLKTRRYKQAVYLWKQFSAYILKDKDPLLRMKKEDLQLLSSETNGFKDPPIEPAHPHGQAVFLVLDDCLSSSAMSLNRLNAFAGYCCNSRHSWTSIMVLTQRAKQLPPVIRSNLTIISHYQLMSKKCLIEEVWPIVSQLLTEEEFLIYFAAATREKHDCLTVDTTAPPGHQVKKNLDCVMSLTPERA